MMKLLLGGTSDSTAILEVLDRLKIDVTSSVVTDYGRHLASKYGQPVIQGRLTAEDMVAFIKENDVDEIIDAILLRISGQAVVNLLMVGGLLPVIGVPVPLKPAPASAPLPCCIKTSTIIDKEEKILIIQIRVLNATIMFSSFLCGADNSAERFIFQRCASDKSAIDMRHAKNFGGIGIVYAAAIKNADISIVATQ